MDGLGAFGNGGGQGFGVACASEATHAHEHAVLHKFGGFGGSHNFFAQGGVANAIVSSGHGKLL